MSSIFPSVCVALRTGGQRQLHLAHAGRIAQRLIERAGGGVELPHVETHGRTAALRRTLRHGLHQLPARALPARIFLYAQLQHMRVMLRMHARRLANVHILHQRKAQQAALFLAHQRIVALRRAQHGRQPRAVPVRKARFEHVGPARGVQLADGRHRHVLDAFLFCCYTGLRYSDFCALSTMNVVPINRTRWLCLKMQKTNIEIKLPLSLLFDGKALEVIDRYPSVEELAAIPSNCETNKLLAEVGRLAGVKKHFTYHTARHTCATLLVHQGVPITTVQKVLGHTSVKTTQIYSEVLSDTIVRDLKSIRKRKRM